KGRPFDHAARRSNPVAPTEKARAVALVLQRADRLSLQRGQVGEPDTSLVRGTRAPRRQQGPEPGHELRLHEQVREGRVGLVRRLRSQYDLGVGREIDL